MQEMCLFSDSQLADPRSLAPPSSLSGRRSNSEASWWCVPCGFPTLPHSVFLFVSVVSLHWIGSSRTVFDQSLSPPPLRNSLSRSPSLLSFTSDLSVCIHSSARSVCLPPLIHRLPASPCPSVAPYKKTPSSSAHQSPSLTQNISSGFRNVPPRTSSQYLVDPQHALSSLFFPLKINRLSARCCCWISFNPCQCEG